jgi:hypothetical protein
MLGTSWYVTTKSTMRRVDKPGVYARKVLGLTPGDLPAMQQEFLRKKPERSHRGSHYPDFFLRR